jgi:hypothetical protein
MCYIFCISVAICESAASRESSVDVIRLDVSRTFPQLGIFQKVGNMEAVFNLC